MIRVRTCFLAEGVAIDRDTGQVSAHAIIEHAEAPQFPVLMQRLAFFVLWERQATDPARNRGEFSITVDGTDLIRQAMDIDFAGGLRCRVLIRIDSLAPPRPGRLVFQLGIPNHEFAQWGIDFTTKVTAGASGQEASSQGDDALWTSGAFTLRIKGSNERH